MPPSDRVKASAADGFIVDVLDSSGNVIETMTVLPSSTTSLENYILDVTFPGAGIYTLRFTEIGDDSGSGALLDNVAFLPAEADADHLSGGDGNDIIYGNGGDDTLSGGRRRRYV